MSSQTDAFRVLIAGGGLSGLALANCLEVAGIDYVLMEARDEIATFVGAGLCLNAGSAPLMEQLGVRKQLFDKITPLVHTGVHLPNGDYLAEPKPGMLLTDSRCGYTRGFIERGEILKALYQNLPESSRKNRLLTGKRIEKIDHHADFVEVTCKDGTTFKGDIIAGCDGVKSKVRSEMWRASNESDHRVPVSEQEPAKATFSCLFGLSPMPIKGFTLPRQFDVIPDRGHSIMWMTAEDKVYWYVCKTLPKKLAPGEQKFTDADAEALAKELANKPVMPNGAVLFKDLWESRTTSILLPTEMGEHKSVAWNRFALLGDAVHKQTISAGQGGNLCMESAAALTNVINRLVNEKKPRKPTAREIDEALIQQYQNPRATRVAEYVDKVNGHTAMLCKYGLPLQIIQEYILPIIPSDALSSFFSDLEVGADMLDFVPPPNAVYEGTMPFNKNLGSGQRESLGRRAKWALPLLALMVLALKEMDPANAGAELAKMIESSKITWTTGEISNFSSFYQIKPIDDLLKVVTTFCAGWTLGFDVVSYWQVLTFFVDYGLMSAIMFIESYRSANVLTLAKLPVIWTLLGQFLGIGVAGQLWFFFHYLSSQMDNYKALDQRTTNLQYTRTLLPAMIIAFYIPFFLSMASPIPLESRLYWTWIWQLFPIWVSIIQTLIAKSDLSKDTLWTDRQTNPGRDLPTLRVTIWTLSTISAATWLFTMYQAPFAIWKEFVPMWTAPQGIWACARNYIAWDHVLGFSGAFLWLALLFKDLKEWEKTDAGWAKLVGVAAGLTVVAGPGATVALGWLWREEMLASKKMKGALLKGSWKPPYPVEKTAIGNGHAAGEKH